MQSVFSGIPETVCDVDVPQQIVDNWLYGQMLLQHAQRKNTKELKNLINKNLYINTFNIKKNIVNNTKILLNLQNAI